MAVKIWDPKTETHEITYEGAVLATFERNLASDSDFIALVWDQNEGRVTTVEYATTRGWTYNNSADVDASDHAKDMAERWTYTKTVDRLIAEHATVVKEGSQVRSLTTRGKAKGFTGQVERIQNSNYDTAWAARYNPTKVAKVTNADTGTSLWIEVGRLKVTTEMTLAEAREEALRIVKGQGVVSLNRRSGFAA